MNKIINTFLSLLIILPILLFFFFVSTAFADTQCASGDNYIQGDQEYPTICTQNVVYGEEGTVSNVPENWTECRFWSYDANTAYDAFPKGELHTDTLPTYGTYRFGCWFWGTKSMVSNVFGSLRRRDRFMC